MKSIVTANYKASFTHDFKEGEYLIKSICKTLSSSYIVDEVISYEKVRVRLVLDDGRLSNVCETISGRDLKLLHKNVVANMLAKELAFGVKARA